jgi:putative transposase
LGSDFVLGFLVALVKPPRYLGTMPRRLRIEYSGAIYHVMARGNAHQDIVHDDPDHRRLIDDLERVGARLGWLVVSFVLMTNPLHLLLKTPRPNLARGLQAFHSGYDSWAARHRRPPAHRFQGEIGKK